MEDKYVGVVLALCSTVFNGTSFVLKKKGLMTSEGHGLLARVAGGNESRGSFANAGAAG